MRRTLRTLEKGNTVRSVVRTYQHTPKWSKLAPSTSASYVLGLSRLAAIEESIWDEPITCLTRDVLFDIRDRVAETHGHGAAAVYCRSVSALFTWMLDRQSYGITTHPFRKSTRDLDHKQHRVWTLEEAEHAAKHLPEPYRRVIVLGMHLGQRRSDLIALQWPAYNNGEFTLIQRKTKVPVTFPCLSTLQVELDAWRLDAVSPTILLNPVGQPWKGNSLSANLPVALQRIGLDKGMNVHGLRGLAAIRLLEAGCTEYEVMALIGWETTQMLHHYAQTYNRTLSARAGVARLRAHIEQTKDTERVQIRGSSAFGK